MTSQRIFNVNNIAKDINSLSSQEPIPGIYIQTGRKFGPRMKEHRKKCTLSQLVHRPERPEQGRAVYHNSQVSHHRLCWGREPCHRLGQGESGRQRGTATDQMDKRGTLDRPRYASIGKQDPTNSATHGARWFPGHMLNRVVNNRQDVNKMSDGHQNVVSRLKYFLANCA